MEREEIVKKIERARKALARAEYARDFEDIEFFWGDLVSLEKSLASIDAKEEEHYIIL